METSNVTMNIVNNEQDIEQTIVEFSFDDKMKLRDSIEKLSETEHIEIFKIFKKYGIDFSENSNGIFINIVNIPHHILKEIDTYIKHLQKVENEISNIENQKNEFKEHFFNEHEEETE